MRITYGKSRQGKRNSKFFLPRHKIIQKNFTTFVRSHLEYCAAAWSLCLIMKHIKIIENVQDRASKMIDGFSDLDYSERLSRLELPTLAFRRLRGDMIEI